MSVGQHDGDASGRLGTHDEHLGDVGRLRGTADERAVAVVVELHAAVGLVHVVDNLGLRQQDDQVLGDEHDGLLLHRLRDPDAAVLGHAEDAADDAHVGAVEVAGAPYGVGVARGDRHFGQVRGYLLGLGVEVADERVDVAVAHLDDLSAYVLAHGDKLCQRVLVGDGAYVAQVGHVVPLAHVSPVSFQYIFLVAHISNKVRVNSEK